MNTNTTPVSHQILEILCNQSEDTRIAVVGASNNPEKYGNIIVENLKAKGYTMLPVNPKEKMIADLAVYSTPEELPDPVNLLVFVTKPKVTRTILEKLNRDRFPITWFQDGSADEETIRLAREKFGAVVANACIMVVSSLVNSKRDSDEKHGQ